VNAVTASVTLDWGRARAYGLARPRRDAGTGRIVAEDTESAAAGLGEGGASHQDAELVRRLLAGDENAFMSLVDMYQASMVRLARNYVPSRDVAEEVVQETWLAVLQGLPRFEARSSLKTWIFRILVNRAITRGTRERRVVPFSALFDASTDAFEPAVDPDRFFGPDAQSPHGWASPPRPWDEIPEQRLESRETLARVAEAIETLPPSQREVITMRDVNGFTSQEVCAVLGITEVNQRVLLHRARSKVRSALAEYLTGEPYGGAS
jgi:RNA polymerase sigma-70 factor (ECF subfamily)